MLSFSIEGNSTDCPPSPTQDLDKYPCSVEQATCGFPSSIDGSVNKLCCGTNEPNNNLMCINKKWQKLEYKTVCEYGKDSMTQESCPNDLNDCPDWF